jgi:hypothetical protein
MDVGVALGRQSFGRLRAWLWSPVVQRLPRSVSAWLWSPVVRPAAALDVGVALVALRSGAARSALTERKRRRARRGAR